MTREKWLVRKLRAVRMRYQAEMALDDQPTELSDEQAALLVDVCRECGLDGGQMQAAIGEAALPFLDWSESVAMLGAVAGGGQ